MRRTQTVVPVLGMHRSGTSLVTRALNILGLDLGWPLQPAGPDNVRGFWEHLWFQRINKELLASVGANTDGWGTQAQLRAASQHTSQLRVSDDWNRMVMTRLEREFQGKNWGFKDPRLVVTWGFWRRFLEQNGWQDIRPVVVVRHPGATLKSVLSRGDLKSVAAVEKLSPAGLFIQIWTTYYSIIFSGLGGKSPLVVTQEDLLDSSSAPFDLERVCHAIDGDWGRIDEALSWVDPSLDHRAHESNIPSEVLGLYSTIASMAKRQREAWIASRPLSVSTALPLKSVVESPVVVPCGCEEPLDLMFASVKRIIEAGSFAIGGLAGLQARQPIWLCSPSGLASGVLPPAGAILVNLAPIDPGTPDENTKFIEILRKHCVLDPSWRNVSTLRRLGVDASLLTLDFGRDSQKISFDRIRSIDVLFFGRYSQRREVVIRQLSEKGLVVDVVTNLFGAELDARIARAKVVLAIHRDPWRHTNLWRVLRPASMGSTVVAERSLDPAGDDEVRGLVRLAWYDELVGTCTQAVREWDSQREDSAAQGFGRV